MGSFRLVTKNSASSRKVQFHWVNNRDSGEIVMPFMQDGTYPPRNFATLGPLWLQPPFTLVSLQCIHISALLKSTGQASDPILHFWILQSPVFLLNSRFSLFYVTLITIFIFKVLFLPKLHSQFAEFLYYCYLNRLSIFYLFTCVGLQYGYK